MPASPPIDALSRKTRSPARSTGATPPEETGKRSGARMLGRNLALLSAIAIVGVLSGGAPALAETALRPSPVQVGYGPVDIHFGGSPRQSVQFTNSSAFPASIRWVAITGANASIYQVVQDGCTGQTIAAPGEPGPNSCTVEVSFTPGAAGAKSAILELYSEAGSEAGTLEVPLSGEGITGTLTAEESPLRFAGIPYTDSNNHEGEQNETEEVTILDGPSAGTQIESVSIAGPDASSFTVQWNNCEHNLIGPRGTCNVGIRFQPVSPGAKQALLVISSDSAGGPLEVPLEGEGLHGPKIGLSADQALLGEVPLGSFVSQTFTLTDTGDYPLEIQQAFLVSGTPLMFPVISDTCSGQIVYPGGACAVTVGFQPTTVGEKDASIIFITSNSLPVNVVGIDGVGVPDAGVQPAVAPQATLPPKPSAHSALRPASLRLSRSADRALKARRSLKARRARQRRRARRAAARAAARERRARQG
jgi:hypothetical protein